MSPKAKFLRKVAVEIEVAETVADALPDNGRAQALRELRQSLECFPEDHAFFKMWQNPGQSRV